MEHDITDMLEHMAKSHEQLARLLKFGRDTTVHMSSLITAIPNRDASFIATEQAAVWLHAGELTASITSYLDSIGNLQEAAAENLELVMKGLTDDPEEE